MDNTDPAHLASCVADWGNYGVSLHPREASGMEENSTGRNYNVVSERDGEIPTSDKKRMLILIVLICSPSTEILMMERLKYISGTNCMYYICFLYCMYMHACACVRMCVCVCMWHTYT